MEPNEQIQALDILKILEVLPHRYPFLLVDRIVEIEKNKRIVGIKNVTYNEPFFMGHFPAQPIMPGVLLVEAMAQTGAVLFLYGSEEKGKIVYLAGVDKARFRRPVTPGDQLRIEVSIISLRRLVGRGMGEITINGELAAEAEITFALRQ